MDRKVVIISLIIIFLIPCVSATFSFKYAIQPSKLIPSISETFSLKYATQPSNLIRAFDSPLAADTNNDGILDSLFIAGLNKSTTGQGIVIRYNSMTGEEIWRRDYIDADASNELNPIELYDVTGDGCPEVFTHFGAPNVGYQVGFICLNGINGSTVWYNLSNNIRPAWHHFVIIADKVTNIPYIFFNGHDSTMKKMDARDGTLITSISSGLSCNGGLSAADMDYNGEVEIVLGLHAYPGFVCYDTNLTKLWDSGCVTKSSTQCTALIDVVGSKTLDCVSLYQNYNSSGITVVDGATHQRVSIMSSTNLGINAHSQGSIADYDSDGNYEITSGYLGYGHVTRIRENNTPQVLVNLTVFGMANGPARFQDLVGDNRFELTATAIVADTINFETIPGVIPCQWNGLMNDIDNDGLSELFGCRNGQITVYDTYKIPVPGINTYTTDYGYRHLNSQIAYPECPGTWWYSWEEWEQDHQPPYKPSDPNPEDGATDVTTNSVLSVYVSDPESDNMDVSFYDAITHKLIGTTYNVPSFTRAQVTWNNLVINTTYFWYAIADDGANTNQSDIWEFTTVEENTNHPPEPPTIYGRAHGKVGTPYYYGFTSVDPYNDLVYFFIDWGDGTNSSWIGPYPSGEQLTQLYSWSKKGTYIIQAKAKDIFGAESNWATLTVVMPKNKAINSPILNFIKNYPNLFSILQIIIQLLEL